MTFNIGNALLWRYAMNFVLGALVSLGCAIGIFLHHSPYELVRARYSIEFAWMDIWKIPVKTIYVDGQKIILYVEHASGDDPYFTQMNFLEPIMKRIFSDFPRFIMYRRKFEKPHAYNEAEHTYSLTLVTRDTYNVWNANYVMESFASGSEFFSTSLAHCNSKSTKMYFRAHVSGTYPINSEEGTIRHEMFHALKNIYKIADKIPHEDN